MAPSNDINPQQPRVEPTPTSPSPSTDPVANPDGEPSTQFTTQPQTDSAPAVAPLGSAMNTTSKPAGNKKKKIIIGVIAAVVAVLLLGGSAFAFWYNKPENVVADSLQKLTTAKSGSFNGLVSLTPKQEEGDFKMTFNGSSNEALETNLSFDATASVEGRDYALKADFATDKDSNTYVKIDNVRSLADEYFAMLGGGDTSVFDSLIEKVDNKWIVITKDDLKDLSEDSSEQRLCAGEAIKKIQSDKNQQNQLADAYKKNMFVVVKESKGTETIEGEMSNHYVIDLDYTKLRAFTDAAVETDAFKALDTCYDGELKSEYDANKDDIKAPEDASDTTVEVWVGTFSHNLTKFKISGSDDEASGNIEATLKLNNNPTVVIPKGETTVDDITEEFEKIQTEMMSAYQGAPYTTEDSFGTDVLGMSTLLN